MTSNPHNVQLIGFQDAASLSELFAHLHVFQDYRAALPEHLLEILRKQHPSAVIESVELLAAPTCNAGGMQLEPDKKLIQLQSLDVNLDLRVILCVGRTRLALDTRLVIKSVGLDSTPTTTSDMFVKAQRSLE